jgi:hypothetical protein
MFPAASTEPNVCSQREVYPRSNVTAYRRHGSADGWTYPYAAPVEGICMLVLLLQQLTAHRNWGAARQGSVRRNCVEHIVVLHRQLKQNAT